MRFRFLTILLLGQPLFAAAVPADHAARMAQGQELFNSHVAQLLKEHCVKCHGGEKGIKGDLDLTTRELLLKGGEEGPAIVPGNPAGSYLMKLIRHEEDPAMPKKGDKLPEQAIATIARWIELGAPYSKPLLDGRQARNKAIVSEEDRQFWAFRPLATVAPPTVRDDRWARTPIDRFILQRLEEKGIAANPIADKRTLIRRAFFDLIGLPPTAEQVERFVGDASPDAYGKVIDELLASPHYGERWGRHWLDLARFAESHGYEQDYDRKFAFHYRDFVIQALNEDLPYDQFVRWQIAGDELAPENPQAWKATGFLAAGTHATQITANQAEKERYDELDDMAATIGTAMLGLTVGCARCHDHKFDPLPTSDYYRLISTFTTTVRSDYDVEVGARETRERREVWERAHAPLVAALRQFERERLPSRFAEWLKSAPVLPQPAWLTLEADQLNVSGPYYSITKQDRQPDGSYLVTVTAGTPDTYNFKTSVKLAGITAIRLEALADKSLPAYGPGWSGSAGFKMTEISATVKSQGADKTTPVAIKGATDWDVAKGEGQNLAKVFPLAQPIGDAAGMELNITLRFDSAFDRRNIGRFRLAITTASQADTEAEPLPLKDYFTAREALKAAEPNAAQRDVLLRLYRTIDPEWRALANAVRVHAASEPRPQFVKALVCSEGLPAVRLHTQGPDFYEKTFFLKRGDLNQKDGEAPPGFVQVLTRADEKRWLLAPPQGARTPHRRAALARWITDSEAGAGHLLARVIVNRLWQHHFGRGLVATPSDFGAQGEKPSHPELLDWLAAELIRGGWKLKPLHKLMMTSSVYMQSAATDAACLRVDRENALCWHRPRHRLEGEIIRDAILAVTGTLDRTMFGPGTLDSAMKRRSIYFQLKRSQLPPMLATFDAPDTLQSMGQRASTTVAPQALLLMNNAQIRAAVRDWAKALAATPIESALTNAYLTALGRPPADDERAVAASFLTTQTASYKAAGKADSEQLALADLCQSLVSVNEFVYVD